MSKGECTLCGERAELESARIVVGQQVCISDEVCHDCCHCEICGIKLEYRETAGGGFEEVSECHCFDSDPVDPDDISVPVMLRAMTAMRREMTSKGLSDKEAVENISDTLFSAWFGLKTGIHGWLPAQAASIKQQIERILTQN